MKIIFERGHSSESREIMADVLGLKPDLHRVIVSKEVSPCTGKPHDKIVWVGESKSKATLNRHLREQGYI